MDGETVIENIQVDAGAEGGLAVAGVTVAAVGAVAEQVAQVGDELTDHAELSEERHEEILQGEAWTRNQLELLLTNGQQIQTQLMVMQAAMLAELSAVRARVDLAFPNPSPVSPPSTLEPQPEVVEVESVAVDPVAVETPEVPRRRKRVI